MHMGYVTSLGRMVGGKDAFELYCFLHLSINRV